MSASSWSSLILDVWVTEHRMMKANVGDFLVVKGTTTERHDQHAEIIEVRAQDGSPPYVVRWLVTDHEATVYPGCDAVAAISAAFWSAEPGSCCSIAAASRRCSWAR